MAEIRESVLDVFNEIKKELNDYYIFKEKVKVKDYLLRKFYEILGRHIKSSNFDYNSVALTFNKVYFWKNLLKNLIFFDEFYDLIGDSILDVGCGAAPVSIAIAELMKHKEEKKNSFTLMDKSRNQLSVAKDITQLIDMKVESYIEGFFEITFEKHSELVVFSYFFCEQERDFLKRLFNNRENFSGGFVVIDYKDNVMKIEKYFRENGDNRIKAVSLNYSVPFTLSKLIYDTEVNVHACIYRP